MRLFLATLLVWALPHISVAGDETVQFDADDPLMTAAVSAARETLASFLDHTRGNGAWLHPDAEMKVALHTTVAARQLYDVAVEIIWVSDIKRNGKNFTGRLANAPNMLGDLQFGDQVSFTQAQIRDWSLPGADGRMFGHYTTRVVLDRLPPEQAAGYREYLSENPAPSGWLP